MPFHPDGPIVGNIHQVPRRKRQRVQVLQVGPPRSDDQLTVPLERQAQDGVEVCRLAQQMVDNLAERLLALADQHVVCAGVDVRLGVVGRI